MSIYLYKNNQQEGPYEESTVREWLQSGQISPNDSAIREGMTEWQPLHTLLSLGAMPPVPNQSPQLSPRIENELRLLERYDKEIDSVGESMQDADDRTVKQLQKQMEQKIQIYEKQVSLLKSLLTNPNERELYSEQIAFHEANGYTHRAFARMFAKGFMRRRTGKSKSLALNIATGLIANQQEKNNAYEAIKLIDTGLGIYDFAGSRLLKAQILNSLGQKSQALTELNYIIEKFPDENEYLAARQLKDEIENPPKKGMCFVATAAYGSPLAPEVVLLSRFRDEVLLQSKLGAMFVAAYYRVSPPLASLIGKVVFLRAATRTFFLAPILRLVKSLKFNE